MRSEQQEFLFDLLETANPSGYETATQEVWTEHVERHADEVSRDAYGNTIAVLEGEADSPSFAFEAHADEVGYTVTNVDDEGFLRLDAIGNPDPSVSRGQHVSVHTEDSTVNGVIGQAPAGVRDAKENEHGDISDQTVDIGAGDEAEARALVDVGDPVTVGTGVRTLDGTRMAGRGLDDRVGMWVIAEVLRRASVQELSATVYAVSTVQEEIGSQGVKMVREDIYPDATVAVDVTDASDHPEVPDPQHARIHLGEGPVVTRGSANHPKVVQAVREAADAENIDIQLQAAGTATETDADALYTASGGRPSLTLGLPNRYMHTPVEVVDTDDLDAAIALLVGFTDRETDPGRFQASR